MGTNDKASCLLVIKGRVYDTASELKAKGCSRLELQKIEFLCKRTQFELMYYQWLGWYGNRQRIVMSLVSIVILIYCRLGTDEVDGCSRDLFVEFKSAVKYLSDDKN